MTKPWEKYQPQSGPWEKYAKPEGAPDEADDGFSVAEMGRNILPSAGRAATGVVNTVTRPVDTIVALRNLFGGAVQKAGKAAGTELLGDSFIPHADAVADQIKDRYGSIEAATKTLEQDPVGVAVDLASIVSGAGAVSRSAAVKKAGAAVNPVNLAKNTAKTGVAAATPKNLPANMYEGAAKFSTTIPSDKRAAMTRTALKNEIMPTSKGVKKLEGLIGDLGKQIDTLITDATASGKNIPRGAIYKHLNDLRASKGGAKLGAPQDLEGINRIVRSFDQHLKKLGKDRLTPAELQAMKVDAYKKIGWDAKRMKGTPIKEDTYKAIARGAKEGVEQTAPGVKTLNREMGELLELQPAIQRSAGRIENRNMIPIDAPLQIGAGAGVGGGAGAAIGTVASLFGLPKIKAQNAIWLQRNVDRGLLERFLNNNTKLSNAELIAILAGRATEDGQPDTPQE